MAPVMNVILINDALEGVESKIALVRQHIQTSGFQTGAPEQGEVLAKLMHELVHEVIFAEEKIVPTEQEVFEADGTAAVEAEAKHEGAPVVDAPPVVSDETHVAESSSAVAVESNTEKGGDGQL